MSDREQLIKRVESGIPGLDEMLKGGFFENTVNIVSAPSGAGKTILGAQFLHEGIKKGQKTMCILISEESRYIKKEMYTSFGWDFWELEEQGKISFVDIADPALRLQKSVEVAPTELIKSFKKLIKSKIESEKPDRVFIDSSEALFLAITDNYKLRSLVDDLFGVLHDSGATSIITVANMYGIDTIVEYGADSVIRIGRVMSGNTMQRSIQVMKLRGSGTINEMRVLNISDAGMKVLAQSPYTDH